MGAMRVPGLYTGAAQPGLGQGDAFGGGTPCAGAFASGEDGDEDDTTDTTLPLGGGDGGRGKRVYQEQLTDQALACF